MRIQHISNNNINIIVTLAVCGVLVLSIASCLNTGQFVSTAFSYVCSNGVSADGDAEFKHAMKCSSCQVGYILDKDSGICRGPRYACANGTPAVGATLANEGVTKCVTCDSYYKLNGDMCVPTVYTCDNGTVANGSPNAIDDSGVASKNFDVQKCDSCDSGYMINSEYHCKALQTFSAEPVLSGSIGTTTATIRLTTSQDAGLWWVAYSDGTIIESADTVIADANGAGGVKRSGGNSIVASAGSPHAITIDNLRPSTAYDFYMAIQEDATGEKFLASKVHFTTATVGFPAFTVQPTASAIAQATASVAFTVDETADLHWVVYGEDPDHLTPLQLKTDAITGGGIVADGGITVSANVATSIDISGLTAAQSYYFYAVIADDEGSMAISSVLPFVTDGYPFVCSNGIAATGMATTENIDNCASCASYYKLDSNNSCVATVYTCSNGDPASGNPNAVDDGSVADTNADIVKCGSCKPGFLLDSVDNTCDAQYSYVCSNGTPADGADASTDGDNKCGSCYSGYKLNGDSCEPTIYTCQNGTPLSGSPSGNADVAVCISCNDFYKISDGSCQPTSYICPNGTVVSGSPNAIDDSAVVNKNADIVKCSACSPGFMLDSVDSTCGVQYSYVCSNGTPADGADASTDGDNKCGSCYSGYKLNGDSCEPTIYTCQNGTPLSGSPSGNADVAVCISCNDFYKISDGSCQPTSYICPNGTAVSGSPNAIDDSAAVNKNADIVKCDNCDSHYTLDGDVCIATVYTCTDGTPSNGSPSGNVNVEKCDTCHLGYVLSSEQCVTFSLTHVVSITDSDNIAYELSSIYPITTATIADTTYLFVSSEQDNGISVFSVGDNGTLTNVDNVDGTSDTDLSIAGASSLATASVGGTTYLYVAGRWHSSISVFSIGSDGILTYVESVDDNETYNLWGVRSITTTTVGGTTYLFVAGTSDNGVSVFSVATDGTLTHVASVADSDDAANYHISGAWSVTTANIDDTTYLFVAGFNDNGISVFTVGSGGTLTNVANVSDYDDSDYELQGAISLSTALVGDTTYLYVAGYLDNGVSVFSVENDGTSTTLTNVDNVMDNDTYQLTAASAVTTATIAGNTYLFVTGYGENGASAFSVDSDGTLAHVASVSDNATYHLFGAISVATSSIGDTTYLFIAGNSENGLSVFSIP